MNPAAGNEERPVPAPWSMHPRSGMVVLLLLLPALIFLDYRAGPGLSLRFFYLIPTALAAWVLGRGVGIVVAVVSAAFCLFVDVNIRPHGAVPMEIVWEGASNMAVFVIFAIVVARHRRFMDEAAQLTRVDEETGLLSRHEFERLLEGEKRRSRRYRRPLAAGLIECTRAKGRAEQALLAAVGRVVQQHLREGDFVGLAGEHRIGVVLLECPPPIASQVLGRIRQKLLETMADKLRVHGLGLSLICYGGQTDTNATELLAMAAERMHVAHGDSAVGVSESNLP